LAVLAGTAAVLAGAVVDLAVAANAGAAITEAASSAAEIVFSMVSSFFRGSARSADRSPLADHVCEASHAALNPC